MDGAALASRCEVLAAVVKDEWATISRLAAEHGLALEGVPHAHAAGLVLGLEGLALELTEQGRSR